MQSIILNDNNMRKKFTLLAAILCCIATVSGQIYLPLTEDFSDATFPPTGWTQASTNTTNWSRYEWESHSAPSSASIGWADAGSFQYLTTPQLAISADTAYEVKFWMYRNNSSWYSTKKECLRVYSSATANDITDATLLGSIVPYYENAPAEAEAGWHQYSFALPVGTTNSYVVFCYGSDGGGGCYIDDILIRKVPSCQDIAGAVTISNVGMTSMDVTIADATATSWEAGYRVSGSSSDFTYVENTASSLTIQLTGLQSSTYYEIVARRKCGSEYGDNTSSKVVNTLCSAIDLSTSAFVETFDNLTPGAVGGCYNGEDCVGQYSTLYALYVEDAANAYSGNNYFSAAYSVPSTYAGQISSGSIALYRSTHLEVGKYYEVSVYAKKDPATWGDMSYRINFVYGTNPEHTTMTAIASCNVTTDSYVKCVAYFQVAMTGDYYLGFYTDQPSGSGYYVYADNFAARELTIIPPTGISAVPTSRAANFTFTNGSPKAELFVDTVEADVMLGRVATVTELTGTTASVTGLEPNTKYYYAMRAIDGNDTSVLSVTSSFITMVEPDTIPFREDFEGYTAYDWTGAEWATKAGGGSYKFKVLTGEAYNHTAEGNQGVTVLSSGTDPYTMPYQQAFCRNVSLEAGKTYQMSVYTYRYQNVSYDIEFVVGTTMDNLAPQWETVRMTNNDWTKVIGYVTVPQDGEYYIGFRSYNNESSYLPIYDDIEFREVTCTPPSLINVQNISANNAEIHYTTNYPITEIVVDTVKADVLQGRIFSNNNVSTSPVTLTGLTPNTAYYYALRTINGTDISDWSMVGEFRTTCVPVDELPFIEDFEDMPVGMLGGCYTFTSANDRTLNTFELGDCNHTEGGTKGLASANGAASTDYTGSTNVPMSFSRNFELEAGKNYELSVYSKCSYASALYNIDFMVNDDVIDTKLVDDMEWTRQRTYFTVDADGVYTIGIAASPASGTWVTYYFDDITIREVTCITPDVVVMTEKNTTASVMFTTGAGLYEIVYDVLPIDFSDMLGALYHDTVTTDGTLAISNLDESTEYHFAARLVCGDEDMSDWSEEITFKTACAPHAVPYTEDFESYVSETMLPECMNPFPNTGSLQPYVYAGADYNNTSEGSNGLISYDIYDDWSIPAITSFAFGFSDFVSFEAGKAYEISIYAKKSSGDYNLAFAVSGNRNYEAATPLAVDTVNSSEFTKYTAYYIAEQTEGMYVHVFAQKSSSYHGIIFDDYAIRTLATVVVNDTMCREEENYQEYGFEVNVNELQNGDNVLNRESGDTLYRVNLYLDPADSTFETYELKQGETYTWNGQTISAAGTYEAVCYTRNGCEYIATLTVSIVSGIENVAERVITLAPNPINGGESAYVYGNIEDVKSVEILNNLGQVISAFEPTTSPIVVEGINMPGLYYVRLITNDGTSMIQKLIVK